MSLFYPNLAITGGIGSGKSTVLELFEQSGYEVINMDNIAHSFMNNQSALYLPYCYEIDNWLGTQFSEQTQINKAVIREKLQTVPNGYEKIAHIAAPYITIATQEAYLKASQKTQKIVFEVPLLFEMKMQSQFAKILVVTCDYLVKKQRIQQRDPYLTDEMIEKRIQVQSSDEEKLTIADFVIDNSGTKEELEAAFHHLLPIIENSLSSPKYRI